MPARNQLDQQQGWLAACAALRGWARDLEACGMKMAANELRNAADELAIEILTLPHWLTKLKP